MDHVRSLVQLAGSAQERLLLLRHCVATKLTHIARFASAELYERATRELQDAIEDEIRAIAKALPSEFGGDGRWTPEAGRTRASQRCRTSGHRRP